MLTRSLDIARSGLAAGGEQSSAVSRNIANAGNALASRKIANTVTLQGGGVVVATITRVSNEALTNSLQSALSSATGQKALAAALDRLDATVNDPSLEVSPAALIEKLREALQVHAGAPDNPTAASSVINAATQLAFALNEASATVQTVRREADAEMRISVGKLNSLLGEFGEVNSEIVRGTRMGFDVTDQLDQRDGIVRQIAEETGIRILARSDGDMALLTENGLTLFDRTAGQVTMPPAGVLAAGVSGAAVYIDGVAITGSGAMMRSDTGRISGLAAARDEYAPEYQRQLDEIARGLIEAFRETDQGAVPALPDIPGLFTYSGAPAMPSAATVMDGLAASLRVNPNVDPAQGGNLQLLRDGAIGAPGNPAYVYNSSGAAGYSGRLNGLIDAISAQRSFDPASGLRSPANLVTAASQSAGWLESSRQTVTSDAEYRTTLADRARDALSRATGVNLDEQMTSLLDIERSYQASSKLLSVIDGMFRTLLNAT